MSIGIWSHGADGGLKIWRDGLRAMCRFGVSGAWNVCVPVQTWLLCSPEIVSPSLWEVITEAPLVSNLFRSPKHSDRLLKTPAWNQKNEGRDDGAELLFSRAELAYWEFWHSGPVDPAPSPYIALDRNKLNPTSRPSLEKERSHIPNKELLSRIVHTEPRVTMVQFSSSSWVLIIEYTLLLRRSSIVLTHHCFNEQLFVQKDLTSKGIQTDPFIECRWMSAS